MAERDLVLVEICDNPVLAEEVKCRLEEAEIPCMVIDQTLTGVNGGYSALPGFAIKVFSKYEERARAIVDEIMDERRQDVSDIEE